MQITRANLEHKSNLTRALSRHRHSRLRQDAPRPEFRAWHVEPREIDAVSIDVAGGGSRSLLALIDGDER
jgi:hypothetical protein